MILAVFLFLYPEIEFVVPFGVHFMRHSIRRIVSVMQYKRFHV